MHQFLSTMLKNEGATTPIDLQSLKSVARGKQRDIYYLACAPEGASETQAPAVLKVPRYAERGRRQPWVKQIVRKFFPTSAMRIITTEANYLKKLIARSEDGATSLPLPSFYGFIPTTGGPGTVWEAICDEDHKLAPTLATLARQGEQDRFLEPLNRLVKTCYAMNMVAPDMHAGNLLYVCHNGEKRVVLIDGFGDHRLISIRAVLPWYNARSLHKSFEKMASKTGLRFDREQLTFSQQHGAALESNS